MASNGYPDGRTRRTLETLAGRGDTVPELDVEFDEAGQLINWHQEIRKSCGNSGFGALPVTPSMISDWQDMSGEYSDSGAANSLGCLDVYILLHTHSGASYCP